MKKIKYILASLFALASMAAHAQVFDVTITPTDGSDVFTKTSATSIEIKPGDESPIHVFSGGSDTQGESLTVAHGVRYDFALTPVNTINSGNGVLPEGNFPAQAPMLKAPAVAVNEPVLTGPALVIMLEEGDPIIYYAEDATEGQIKLKINPQGKYMVENTVVDGVTNVFYKDVHTPVAHAAVDATCTAAGNSAYWSCSHYGCNKYFSNEACTTEIEKDSWITPASGHAYVEDAENHKVTCSNTGCTLEALMLTMGANTGLTYAANSSDELANASAYTTLYYFKAPVSGTLTVTDSNGDTDDSYGALFNEDMSDCLTSNDNGNGNCFKLTYDITEGQVYWIGARALAREVKLTGHTLTISLTSSVTLSKVGDRYYTSFGAPYIYNVTNAGDDIKVYVATSLSNGVLTMNEVGTAAIAAGKGVVIVGTSSSSPETMTATIAHAEEADIESDLLEATTAETSTTDNAFFSAVDGIVGFYGYNTTLGAVPAGKACLPISEQSSDVKGFRLMFENKTTGIDLTPALFQGDEVGKCLENGRVIIVRNDKKFNVNGQEVK